jgi:hypothetical protein
MPTNEEKLSLIDRILLLFKVDRRYIRLQAKLLQSHAINDMDDLSPYLLYQISENILAGIGDKNDNE